MAAPADAVSFADQVAFAHTSERLEQVLQRAAEEAKAGSQQLAKASVIDICAYKRGVSPALWNHAVAVAFGDLLRCLSEQPAPSAPAAPPHPSDPTAPSAPPAPAALQRQSSFAAPVPAAFDTPGITSVTGSLIASPGGLTDAAHQALANDMARSKHRLLLFSVAEAVVALVFLIGSAAAGRQFGGYFAANIAATVVSVYGAATMLVRFRTLRSETKAIEQFAVMLYCIMAAGLLLGVVFTFQVTDRVDEFCEDNEAKCDGHSKDTLHAAATIATLVCLLLFAAVLAVHFALADSYLTVARLSASLVEGRTVDNGRWTATQLFIANNLAPSRVCWTRCMRRRCRQARFHCAPPTLSRDCQHRLTMAFAALVCLFVLIGPPIACSVTDDAVWCVLAVFSRILCALFTRGGCY